METPSSFKFIHNENAASSTTLRSGWNRKRGYMKVESKLFIILTTSKRSNT